MFIFLIVLILGFFFAEFVGYILHRFLHSPLSGYLNKMHMTHHLKLYPPDNFLSRTYRSPGKDNTVLIFGTALVAMCALMFILLPVKFAVILSIEFLIVGIANDRLHDIMHISPNVLEKSNYFQYMRALHIQHHRDMKTNFGIFSFMLDHLFRTFVKP